MSPLSNVLVHREALLEPTHIKMSLVIGMQYTLLMGHTAFGLKYSTIEQKEYHKNRH